MFWADYNNLRAIAIEVVKELGQAVCVEYDGRMVVVPQSTLFSNVIDAQGSLLRYAKEKIDRLGRFNAGGYMAQAFRR